MIPALMASRPRSITSLNDATATPGQILIDSLGNKWGINGAGLATFNGTAQGYTANVTALAYVNGVIWQVNATNEWYYFTVTNGVAADSATGIHANPLPVLTDITLTNSTFASGSLAGALVGTLSVTATSGSFSTVLGSLSVGAAATGNFTITGTALKLAATVPPGLYSVPVIATQNLLPGSPLTRTFTVTGIGNEASAGTTVTASGVAINASPTPGTAGFGNLVTITSGAQLAVNSQVIGATANVRTLYYIGNTAFQKNASEQWYGPITATDGGALLANPPVPLPTVLLSNNTISSGSAAGTIIGALSTTVGAGNYTWTYSLSGGNSANFLVSGTAVASAPGPATGLTPSVIASTSLTLGWGAASGTTPLTYQPQRSTDSGATWLATGASTLTSGADITGLTPSAPYQFRIHTTNPSIYASDSTPISVTMLAASAESLPGTTVTASGVAINASPTPGTAGNGNLITITSGAQVMVGSSVIGTTGNVTALYYIGSTAFQKNATSQWYGPIIAGNGGSAVNPPQPTTRLSNSTIGSGLPAGTAIGTLTTSTGAGSYTWTYSLAGVASGSFQLAGSTLQTRAPLASGAYALTLNAANAGITGSPFSSGTTITVAGAAGSSTYFSVKNGKIYKPDGVTEFVPRGLAINYADMPFAVTNQQGGPLTSLFKNINIVRFATADTQGDKTQTTSYAQASYANLKPLVDILTPLQIVLAINDHTTSDHVNNGGGNNGTSHNYTSGNNLLQPMLNWYIALATAFKGNPYVWFGTRNEPPNDSQGALTVEQKATYDAIRGTGNGTIIEIEQVGGGVPPGYAASPVTEGLINNADNTNGLIPTSVYRAMTNIIWGPHNYNWLTNYSSDPTANANAVAAHVNACAQLTSADGSVPVAIWEYAVGTVGPLDNGGFALATAVEQSANGSIAWFYDKFQQANSLTNAPDANTRTTWGDQTANWLLGHPYP